MLKKILSAVALATMTSSVAFADTAGPYLGAGLAVSAGTSSVSSYRGSQFSLLAGYGGVFAQNLYAAFEIFGDGRMGTFNDNGPTGTSLQIKYDYGASIIPGFVLNQTTLPYVRLGILRARYNNQNITVTGYQVGAGFQINLAPCWDMRPEYIYTAYRQVSGEIGDPKTDQVKLSLIYRFS